MKVSIPLDVPQEVIDAIVAKAKEFKILFERQREKHPLAHKEQKSDAIKHINEVKKRWPKSISDPASVEHVNYILKICRKRTTAKQ